MGAALKIYISGEEGCSSSPKSPTKASDSTRFTNLVKLLVAVGEGEFKGTPAAADKVNGQEPYTWLRCV
ncbi:hypothetical protein [Pseudomonas syringae]|uniref:hypothetical protein n=1 Tax=Pseudomonas syringae TaxID=317 RepID=UPI000EFFF515|nr:hypothetical protein [Pseudomonas syringae]